MSTAEPSPEEIRALLAEVLKTESISPDTDLIDSGLLDSLAVVELLFQIEHRYGVAIPFDELDLLDLRTTGSIGTAIAAWRGRTGTGA